MIRNKKLVILEVAGALFIIFFGASLHFTFEASGYNPVVGAVSAVNESVWEHLKLPFWSSIFWLLITMYPLRKTVSNFFSAKAAGLVVMLVIIPVVFYSYTAFTKGILAVDIGSFVAAAIIGQTLSLSLYKKAAKSRITEALAVAVLVLLVIMFIVFTFYPPHLQPFLDTATGQYGI
ncbi:hypothetical protein GX563_10425 [Candidatus Bathyarchaeota archaeon]|nr:hypothetical protein [Candidatus Bathyarchaeota archaeon]